ncbi:SRPBCC family protein [Rhodocaloribacter sp.]
MSTIQHTEAFEIDRPVEILFPLFSAEGEKLWVPGWDYENVMGGTDLHEDYVFVTRNHDHASTDAVWLVKRYEPEHHRVQFYKVEPGDKVGVITVRCEALEKERTRVEVTYAYVGLSEKGNVFIEGFTSEAYAAFIEEWRQLLLQYFASTG